MPDTTTSPRTTTGVLLAVGFGALVAVALGAFGRIHEPQFFSINVAGFSSGTAVKSWLATLALLLGLFQLGSAFAMYRLIPGGRAPAWMSAAHVWSGRLAVLATVPVAGGLVYVWLTSALWFFQTSGVTL
jgi:Family of unknown function (DUF6529)